MFRKLSWLLYFRFLRTGWKMQAVIFRNPQWQARLPAAVSAPASEKSFLSFSLPPGKEGFQVGGMMIFQRCFLSFSSMIFVMSI